MPVDFKALMDTPAARTTSAAADAARNKAVKRAQAAINGADEMASDQDRREWAACAIVGLSDAITEISMALAAPTVSASFDVRVKTAKGNVDRALSYIDLVQNR